AAFDRLPTGERDRIVEENLESDVDLRGDGRADGEAAGMLIGAIADVLKDVPAHRKGRLADPIGALRTHMGVAFGGTVHSLGEVVAPDAGIGANALRNYGRRVVRTAGAEIGRALGYIVAGAEHLLGRLQVGDGFRQAVVGNPLQHALADGDGDLVRIERALRRKQPLAAFVLLADDDRLIGGAVERLLDLAFDQRP